MLVTIPCAFGVHRSRSQTHFSFMPRKYSIRPAMAPPGPRRFVASSMRASMAAQDIVAMDWLRPKTAMGLRILRSRSNSYSWITTQTGEMNRLVHHLLADYVSLNLCKGVFDSEARKRIMELEKSKL